MSWLFSRALVEEFSAVTCSDGEPFAQLNVMPTPHKFWHSDKTMEPSDLSQFGLTCAALTQSRGEGLLTSFLAAFPARTSASPARALASLVREAASGRKWSGSVASFDPISSGWRTAQPSLFAGLSESSPTWPRFGMTADGWCWALPTSELRIAESDSGCLLPTPTASSYGSCQGGSAGRDGQKNRPSLQTMAKRALWPTPTSVSGHNVGRLDEWGGSRSRAVMRTLVSTEEIGGPLNPTWVEWLMGWPLGWSDCAPLETAKFQRWQQQHSPLSALNSTEDIAA